MRLHMNKKTHTAGNFNCYFSKINDFSRSQPVTYTINGVIFRKRCKMKSSLLRTIIVQQPNPISGLDVVLEYKVFLMLIIDA